VIFTVGDHAVFKAEEAIIRCKCGQELTNLQTLADNQTATRFLTERCEECGEIASMLAEEKRAMK